jgi:hypothetical protein
MISCFDSASCAMATMTQVLEGHHLAKPQTPPPPPWDPWPGDVTGDRQYYNDNNIIQYFNIIKIV